MRNLYTTLNSICQFSIVLILLNINGISSADNFNESTTSEQLPESTANTNTSSPSNSDETTKILEDESVQESPTEVELIAMTFQYISDKKIVHYEASGSPRIVENTKLKISLFGTFPPETKCRLTTFMTCNDPKDKSKEFNVAVENSGKMGVIRVELPSTGDLYEKKAYFCLGTVTGSLKRQGDFPWLVITVFRSKLPSFILWMVIGVLLLLSGIFSGLNLGILSLDKMDLKMMINTGTTSQRQHAKKIRPIRAHGNLLLCSLVFSNVLVNSVLTLLMDELTDGITAVIGSTIAIVIFGEIIPQAVCSRYGLAVGAYTIRLTKLFMCITFPLAFPMSKLLDRILGEEIGMGFTREKLKELVRVVKDEHLLETEEAGIISGTLDFKKKTVKQIMRKIADVFMLPIETTLDFNTMLKIANKGYSRIPIYDGEVTNVIALLNIKQLIMADYKDELLLKDLVDVEYYKTNLFCVFENTRLDFMFRKFREGDRGHMAFVDRVNDEGPGDAFYERIGVVTMEDVLEELLQQEIMDETDVGTYSGKLEHVNL